jgi:adenylylsulfate kinase
MSKSILRIFSPRKCKEAARIAQTNFTEPTSVDYVLGACMMVRRRAIHDAGMLDEDYFLYYEEIDWCLRIKKAGWKVYHLPDVKVYHLRNQSIKKMNLKARVESWQSRYLFFQKNLRLTGVSSNILILAGFLLNVFRLSGYTTINILTLFAVRSLRRRWYMFAYLLIWHVRGRPLSMGIPRHSTPAEKYAVVFCGGNLAERREVWRTAPACHISWHNGSIKRYDRNRRNDHKSGLVWLTGLSSAGKSTIAHAVEKELFEQGIQAYVLDGDNIRHGLNSDLTFSREHRKENLRRIVEVAKIMVDAGIIVFVALISPHREDREYARSRFSNDDFLEIYVKCSVATCEERDPKGNFKKARAGIIPNFVGISIPYEEPASPDLVIDTEALDVQASVEKVMDILDKRHFTLFDSARHLRQNEKALMDE